MSSKCTPLVISEQNLSVAWAKAFVKSTSPKKELIPLVIMVTDLDSGGVREDTEIRKLLDGTLESMDKQSCNTVASTIFPESLWNPQKPRRQLYERYLKILPAIRKCPKNRHGVYFERLIAFDADKGSNGEKKNNQLEHIIQTWLGGSRRRSVLQGAIFDPRRDHRKGPYLPFPCLQHVTFAYYGDGRRLAVNGFYARQYLFERAYGNYLGLCRLGRFVAHELGLELTQMNCTVGIATLEVCNDSVRELAEDVRTRVAELEQD